MYGLLLPLWQACCKDVPVHMLMMYGQGAAGAVAFLCTGPHASWQGCLWCCQHALSVLQEVTIAHFHRRFLQYCKLSEIGLTQGIINNTVSALFWGWICTRERNYLKKKIHLFIYCFPSFLLYLGSSLNSEFGDHKMEEVKYLQGLGEKLVEI